MCKVSIIIVNWNGLEHLATCLSSLSAQTFRNFEVILVDNGSSDGSVEYIREHHPGLTLVTLPENTGFATGNNRGFEHAHGEYIVTLNNDTRVEKDWLEALVGVADRDFQVGMVASRICSFTDPDLVDSVGMGICPDGMARGLYRNRRWSSLTLDEVEDILLPSACAALYKRAMIAETGFFDDDFFAYAEDVDLGLRGRLAGWNAVAATQAVVYHKYSQSSGGFSPFKVYLVERNHYWVAFKNFPCKDLLAMPFFTLWRYVLQAQAVLSNSGTGGEFRACNSRREMVNALLRGVFDSLLGLPQVFRKRRQAMQARKVPMKTIRELLQRHRITFRTLLDRD